MQGLFWSADLNLACTQGRHFLVMMILGIPGVLLFSIGVPLCYALFLTWNRQKIREHDSDFDGSFGFLYQDYTYSCYYWESVVLTR